MTSRKNNDITRDNWRQKRTRRGVVDRNYAKRNLVKNFDQTVEIESDDGMEQNHTMLTAEDQKLIGQARNIFDELLQTEQIYVNKLHVIKRIKEELVNKLRNENYSNAAVNGIDISLKLI